MTQLLNKAFVKANQLPGDIQRKSSVNHVSHLGTRTSRPH